MGSELGYYRSLSDAFQSGVGQQWVFRESVNSEEGGWGPHRPGVVKGSLNAKGR